MDKYRDFFNTDTNVAYYSQASCIAMMVRQAAELLPLFLPTSDDPPEIKQIKIDMGKLREDLRDLARQAMELNYNESARRGTFQENKK